MSIGETIRKYRELKGITQEQLAENMQVSFQSISNWERDVNIPSVDKVNKLADFFEIPVAKLYSDTDAPDHWDLHDAMFSIDHMYTFLRSAAAARGLTQASRVLPKVRVWHAGQVRKGKDQIPYEYHPYLLACHALALGINDDDVIATALLHDVLEDSNASVEDLPVNDTVKEAVVKLTRTGDLDTYYEAIQENRIATLVKCLDRCNNISCMATGFTKERMIAYIDETEQYVIPLLRTMKHNYPEYYNAAFLIKYHIVSVMESLKRLL